MTTTPEIEAAPPATWQELEPAVARILQECGYDVEVGRNVPLARGDVNVDVWADDGASPPNVLIVECKQWARPVTKNVVHAFRAVTGDSGANTGLLVSSAGFQDGAVQAAAYSNVRLLTWAQFQHCSPRGGSGNTYAPSSRRRPTRFTSTPNRSTSEFAARLRHCPATVWRGSASSGPSTRR